MFAALPGKPVRCNWILRLLQRELLLLIQIFIVILLPSASDAQIKYVKGANKVKVDIYYESLCPDSQAFITNNLAKSFNPEIMNLRFIPFGKATIDENGIEFECQHKQPECLRNRVQACSLEWMTTDEDRLLYVVCAMNNVSIQGQKDCVKYKGVDWNDVLSCVTGPIGRKLMVTHGKDTELNAGGPTFIPTITINGKYSKENQRKALAGPESFQSLILEHLRPEA